MVRRKRIAPSLARLLAVALLIQAAMAPPIAFNQTAQERGQGTKPPAGAQAEPRIALVIGNSAYANAPLPNPVNDARDITATLKTVGFEVIPGENLTQAQMIRAIDSFGQRLRYGGVGLFYFAGHGMQVR